MDRYIYGFGGSYIKFYDNLTGGLDIYNVSGTGATRNYGRLEVYGNLSTTGSFSMNGNLNIGNGNFLAADPSNYNRIYPYNGANANMRFVLGHPTAGDFDWEYPINTVLVRLKRNGNFLIGTTTDSGYKLDVNGTIRSSSVISGLQLTNTNSNPVIGSDGSNIALGVNFASRIVMAGTNIDFIANSVTVARFASSNGGVYIGGAVVPTAKLQVAGSITAASALAQGVYFNNTLVAAANNDVLVGLDINPTFTNGAFTGVTNVALRTQTGNVLLATTSGNVGIGTTSPQHKLDITVDNVQGLRVQSNNSGFLEVGRSFGSKWRWTNDYTAANILELLVNNLVGGNPNQNVLTVFGSTKNISIGTTTDAGYKLDVNGTARIQGNTNITGFLSATSYLECRNQFLLRNGLGGGHTSFNIDATNLYLVNSTSINFQIGYSGNYSFILNNADRTIGMADNGATAITNASSVLTLTSTTKGFLQPRMTNAQAVAIATPATGLQAYDTTNNKNLLYNGTAWQNIATESWVSAQGYAVGTPTLDQVVTAGNSVANNGITITKASGATLTLNPGNSDNAIVINNNGFIKFTSSSDSFIRGSSSTFVVLDAGYVSKVQFHWGGSASWINTGGNLLIGTTTDAGYKLDVNGTARIQTNLNVGDTAFTATTPNYISLGGTYANSGYGAKLKLLDSGSTQWGLGISTAGINYYGSFHNFFAGTTTAAIVISPSADTASTSPAYISIGQSYSSVAGANPKLRLFGTTYGLGVSAGQVDYIAPSHVFYANGTEAMRITSAGYIGIGTTTPTELLHIVNNTTGNKFARISAGGSNASAAWVAQNDQVDNIVYRVFGSGVSGTQMGVNLARSASLIANLDGSGKFLIGTYSNTDVVFGAGDQERMRLINNTGNFLIGTTVDVGTKLNVSGDINAMGYRINNVIGYTGILNIPGNPPGMQNVDIQGGIIVNIF